MTQNSGANSFGIGGSLTSSNSSRSVSISPQQNVGPGFGGLVTRKLTPPEGPSGSGTYKTGQIIANQSAPLNVLGITTNGGSKGQYVGQSWDASNNPVYTDGYGNKPPYPTPVANSPKTFFPANSISGTSDAGLLIIQQHEGFSGIRPNMDGFAYPDGCTMAGSNIALPPMTPTPASPTTPPKYIGYGHTLTSAELSSNKISITNGSTVSWTTTPQTGTISGTTGTPLSTTDAALLLKADVKPIEEAIKSSLGQQPLTQGQFDALVDFTYQVGVNNFIQYIAPLINSGSYDKVPNEMIRWCMACGNQRPELLGRRVDNALAWSGTPQISIKSKQSNANATGPVAQIIWCYLTNTLKIKPVIAAGIMGVWCYESSGYQTIIQNPNPISHAYGLDQWTGPRVRTLLSRYPTSYMDLYSQINFFYWEYTSDSSNNGNAQYYMDSATTPEAAAQIFNQRFVRPSSYEQSVDTVPKQNNAIAVYNAYNNTSCSGISGPPSGQLTIVTPSGIQYISSELALQQYPGYFPWKNSYASR